MKKLIIIPAYNEAENLPATINDIRTHAPDFDYIIINDCSTDHTKQICSQNNYPHLNLPINLGIGGAVQTGYQYALNNDLRISPYNSMEMGSIKALYLDTMQQLLAAEHADMVIGSRFINRQGFQSSSIRRAGIKYFTVLIKLLTGTTITDPTSGMRMVSKDLIEYFSKSYPRDYPEPESAVTALAQGRKVLETAVEMDERTAGISSISPMQSIYYMIKVTFSIIIARTVRDKNKEYIMSIRTFLFILFIGITAILFLIHMVRKKKLEIKYAFPWFILFLSILIVTIIPEILETLCSLLGISLPINMLFFFGFCLSLLVIFGLSISVSRLSMRVTRLAQELALLKGHKR